MPGPKLLCYRWRLEGRVQGVGFRWFAMNGAQSLGVRGWVRNLEGGGLEVVGVATEPTLARLDALLREGPPGAKVSRVTRERIPHEVVEAKSFIVKH